MRPAYLGDSVQYVTKSVKTTREGDLVLARDDDGRVGQQRVVRTMAGFCDHLRLVTFVDGDGGSQTLRTTDEHPFWSATIEDWICAGDLEPGMLCEGLNGERLAVESSEHQQHPLGVPVYNFEVENAHTYFVQETPESPAPLLVHNAKKATANPCSPDEAPTAPDPKWTHTWREGREGAAHNATTLGKKMGLKPATESGLDAHHIVQSTNNKIPEFQKARDLLLEHQIDINSSANGVALRTTKPNAPLPADPNLRMHKGGELHTNEGGRRTYQRLQNAVDRSGNDWGTRRQALLDELAKMRQEIVDGIFP